MVCMCHMFTSVGVRVCVYMHMYIYAEVRLTSGISTSSVEAGFLTEPKTCCFSCVASQLALGIPCFYLISLITDRPLCPCGFHMGSEDPNSGPHDCVTSTVSAEPPPQPQCYPLWFIVITHVFTWPSNKSTQFYFRRRLWIPSSKDNFLLLLNLMNPFTELR